MPTRLTINKLRYTEAKKLFEENGCQLLEETYVDTRTPMLYQCSCGKVSIIRLFAFKKGSRCRRCNQKKHTKTYEEVKSYFASKGCVLLSETYINNKTPMKYRCSCGNESEISLGNLRNGRRCKKCRVQRMNNGSRLE